MRKILFVTKSMDCGGVEKTLLNLIQSLDKNKYFIDLLLMEKRGDFLECVPSHVRVTQVDMPKKWRDILKYDEQGIKKGFECLCREGECGVAIFFVLIKLVNRLSCLFFRKSVLHHICEKKIKLPSENYDVVCDYHGYGYLSTRVVTRFKNVRKFTWVHVEKIDNAFYCTRKMYTEFDGIFCVSPQCLTNFKEHFPEVDSGKLILLYNLIHKEEIKQKSTMPLSKKYDTKDCFMIVSVGRLSTQKGFDLAVETADLLRQRGRCFQWIIIGEGPERTNLETMIAMYGLEKNVILHGHDSNPYSYMAMADLYVQTSRFEGFATTLSEAVTVKKPIVSTKFSGVEQQVIEGVNGIIADFNKADIASKIERMMDNPELRLSFAKGCDEVRLPTDKTLVTISESFGCE